MIAIQIFLFISLSFFGVIYEGYAVNEDENRNIYAPKPGSAYHGSATAYPSNDFSHQTGQSKFNHPRYIPRYTQIGKKYFDVSGQARNVKPGANYDNRFYALIAKEGYVPHTEDSRLIKDPNDVHSVNIYTEKLRSHTRKMNQQSAANNNNEPSTSSNKRKTPSTSSSSATSTNKRTKTH